MATSLLTHEVRQKLHCEILRGAPLFGIITIAIGEGYPNPLLLTLHEQVVSFYMLVMIVGIPVSWKWPAQGGVMLVAGYFAFRGDEIMHNVPLRLFGFLDLFLLLGLLNILVWWAAKRSQTKP